MGKIRGSYNAGENHPCFGKKLPKSTREKISRSLLGRKMPEWIKKKISTSLKGRTFTKEHREKNSLSQVGSKNHNWKGGVTYFNTNLRQLEKYKEWRNFVFRRDKFCCSSCGVIGGYLEANHKIPFCIKIEEFLKFYNKFSPIEDRETLIKLAFYYDDLWDTENGETLCKNCHLKTKTYGVKAQFQNEVNK